MFLQTPNGDIGASTSNPVVTTLKKLRAAFPSLLLACDVCLCPYTDHGHCGVLGADGYIDRNASNDMLARVAKNFALAGADVVAPSDMMDGRVGVIKKMLREIGYENRVIMWEFVFNIMV